MIQKTRILTTKINLNFGLCKIDNESQKNWFFQIQFCGQNAKFDAWKRSVFPIYNEGFRRGASKCVRRLKIAWSSSKIMEFLENQTFFQILHDAFKRSFELQIYFTSQSEYVMNRRCYCYLTCISRSFQIVPYICSVLLDRQWVLRLR